LLTPPKKICEPRAIRSTFKEVLGNNEQGIQVAQRTSSLSATVGGFRLPVQVFEQKGIGTETATTSDDCHE